MARKSASKAKVKPVEIPQEEGMPLEDLFDVAKRGFVTTVDTNILTAKRIDNLMNIRDYACKFWHGEDKGLGYYKSLQELSIRTYENIKEVAEGFTLEMFSDGEMDDLFGPLLPKPEDIEDEEELCRAGLIFLTVRPYGEKMLKLHNLVQEEIGKRGAAAE